MKEKMEKAPILIFLGLTIGLTTFLGYTTYVWISVGTLFNTLDQNTTIDNIQISTQNNSTSMNVTITITNPLVFSYVNTYISIESLITDNKSISLEDYYKGQLPGTFGNLHIPPNSKTTIKLGFKLPQNSSSIQESRSITLNIRLLATTAVNEGSPQTIDFAKQYQLQNTG
jgi:hypothetical protein